MYCSQCGTQVPDDSGFCHECGAALAPAAARQPAPVVPTRRSLLVPALAAVVIAGVVGALILLVGGVGGGGGSDEGRVEALIERSVSLFREGDIRGLYGLVSPERREDCPFELFAASTSLGFLGFLYTGGEDVEVKDISVSVEGDTADALYDLYVGGEFFTHVDSEPYVKVDGRWYVDEPCW